MHVNHSLSTFALLLAALGLQPAAAQDAGRPSAPPSTTTVEPETTKAADAAPATEAPSAADGEQLGKIEDELARVMDELVSARARAGVLAQALFRTSLEVEVMRRSDDVRLEHVTLRLDGVPVHDGDGSALASDRARLFQGHVAPGMHELALEISERAKEDAEFGYVRSERYRIDVKNKRRTRVELIVRDDSDMAEQAPDGDDGSYAVETELRVSYERASD